ncbi:Calx-beta domain-containing protein [Ahniella affigens]|nr:Calx-beta domain-containing protein [Ahniella affigens]
MRSLRWCSSVLLAVLSTAALSVSAQCVSLTTLGSASTQNFDTLSNTAGSTTNNLTITGWFMTETGGGARDNEQYAVDTGASNTGDTFSYGAAAATDRALGGLQSGTLIPVFGACFTNNTGQTITSLDVAYTGEEWRLGTAARADQIDFQFSLNANDLTLGTWTDVNTLDFNTPDTATTGAKDGNAASSRTARSSTISSLSIVNGATFWIRWTDVNASGADDGLAVDDFSLTPQGAPALPNLTINDVTLAEGNAGTTSFLFTVSLSAPAGPGGVTFDIATSAGSATTGSDFNGSSLTGQTIPAGSSTYAFTTLVFGDTSLETNETFFVNVTNVVGANATDAQGLGTINNDDTVPVSVTAVPTSIQENGGAPLFFSLAPQALVPVSLSVNVVLTGTATNGVDYSTSPIPVVIPASSASASLTVTLVDDGIFENSETVIATIQPGTDYTPQVGGDVATATITDPEDRPTANFATATATVAEGNSGTNNYSATVTLSAAAAVAMEVNYSTADGGGANPDATAPSDYTNTSGTLSFAIGATTADIIVPIVGDTTFESNEDFEIGISSPAPAGVEGRAPLGITASQVVTITNDDAAVPEASIAVVPASQTEDQMLFEYTVTLNPAPAVDTTVSFAVSGTATTGVDFQNLASTTAFFPAGQTTRLVPVFLLNDSLANEGGETIVLTLAAGSGYTVAAGNDVATATIVDDDTAFISVSVAPASVNEDGAGNLTYTFSTSNASVSQMVVDFSLTGTATSGSDYAASGLTVTFPAGSSADQTITVDPTVDATVEADETVILTLLQGGGYALSIGNEIATGTILNDDSVTANIAAVVSSTAENSGNPLTFDITLGQAPLVATTVNFAVSGTATAGTDYPTVAPQSVTFPIGVTTQTVSITPTGDTTVEPGETIVLTLQAGSGYTLGGNTVATGTIGNDDFEADLSLSIVDSPDPVLPGGQIAYVITINNAGPSIADDPSFAFPLPAGLTSVSSVIPADWTCTAPAIGSNGTYACTALSLDPAESAVFTINALVPADAISGTIYSETVTLTADTLDPVPGNNAATPVSTTVQVTAGPATPVPSLDAFGRLLLVMLMMGLVWVAGRPRS